MTTTDADALVDKIEYALWGLTRVYDAPHGGTETGVHAPVHEVVAAVLPIVAEEVRKAKAEAWDRAYWQGVQDEIDSQGFDGGMTGPNRISPYRESGDSDEYVPSYIAAKAPYIRSRGAEDMDGWRAGGAEFDRFLARVRRDAAREALDGIRSRLREMEHQQHGRILTIDAGQMYRESQYVILDYRDARYPVNNNETKKENP